MIRTRVEHSKLYENIQFAIVIDHETLPDFLRSRTKANVYSRSFPFEAQNPETFHR
jgi:hypothetical protein